MISAYLRVSAVKKTFPLVAAPPREVFRGSNCSLQSMNPTQYASLRLCGFAFRPIAEWIVASQNNVGCLLGAAFRPSVLKPSSVATLPCAVRFR